jgi:pyruvate/2-oxoglutarate/acetoin dehydrogenase E1 component
MKPVAEIMICDFALVCMDQIANHAAKLRYMSGGRTNVPITIRMMAGGRVGAFGAQHSQSLEALFTHFPGLKVVTPSNGYDAKGLLLSCIDDPDPCVFIEGLRDYFTKTPVPEGLYKVPLGKARIARPGKHLTIISYGWMMKEALRAAEQLKNDSIEAEVIDLRTLVPLDMPAVLSSVNKTRRAMIVHSAVEFCGFGAELAARIQEALFDRLVKPVARLGAKYTPVPFAADLEEGHFPGAAAIAAKARLLVNGN